MVKNLAALLQGLEILDIHGDPRSAVEGVAYDSRRVGAGDLFVAVRGTRADGNVFVRDAIERGARVIVSESEWSNGGGALTFVHVADSRKALARLAANFFENPSEDFQLIGVTGTNGKTTTTLLLEGILKRDGHSVGVLGTIGYHWGNKRKAASMTTPESLDLQRSFHEMRRDGVTHVVMEVSSHALALGRVEGCAFRAGVFTNLSRDHLDFHVSMEDYFQAKASLFKNFLCSRQGEPAAVINADDPYGKRLMEMTIKNTWSYSVAHDQADVWVKNAELTHSGIVADLCTPHGGLKLRSSLVGRLNLYNLLCAATTALALDIPGDVISEGLESVSFVDGRLQRVPVPRECGFEVVVDYAHTPDAMEKSLGCLREITRGRLLVVFGCGGDRDRGKRPIMGKVAGRLADVVILTSDNPRSEIPEKIIEEIEPGAQSSGLVVLDRRGSAPSQKGYTVEVDRKRGIELALEWAGPGDVVFIGGKGHETYQIIGGQVLPFDDRLVVQAYVQSAYKPS